VHQGRVRAAARFVPGQVLLDYRDRDERRFQQARLAVIAPPRLVAFGSSRVMLVSSEMVRAPAGTFYNAGLSAASVEDFIVLWSVLERRERPPETALFSIDSWAFNRSHPQAHWLEWQDESTASSTGPAMDARRSAPWWTACSTGGTRARSFSPTRCSRHRSRRSSGSVPASDRGARSLRTRSSATSCPRVTPPACADARRAGRLELLWRDMRARHVRLIAYVPPYHPVVWRELTRDRRNRAALDETAAFLGVLARSMDVRFESFADPASVPCGEDEFLDGSHARDSCLRRIVQRMLS